MFSDPWDFSRSRTVPFADTEIEYGWDTRLESYYAVIDTGHASPEEDTIILGMPEPQMYHCFDSLIRDINRELHKHWTAHGIAPPETDFRPTPEAYRFIKDGASPENLEALREDLNPPGKI
jgi:hypothetical protein